jgi:hypothetical protein
MSGYRACKQEDIEQLINNPEIRVLLSIHANRLNELIEAF